ncbi:uncharacterized protein LOC131631582 [Vicia villosa]|uniref:uncharacterized protein LOC131631582 n=1 Tax=Vicia villosa TaxID=3911 RepID=UPI00273C5BEE|nr:uncharacterized protein LOC131631582 [Vicia villosa]
MAMSDPWIRGRREGCLIGPQKQGTYDITVKHLMLPNEKQWDMRVIRDVFDHVACEDILQVPLLKEVVRDRLIWKEEQNGVYSVRSGYRLWRSSFEATKVGMIAFHNWQDWFMAQRNQESGINPQNGISWNPPSEGWLKCNVDAGFNKEWGATNRGWCVRDKSGNFIVAGVAWDIDTLSILEAEASAIKEAIEGAIAMHLENVIFESDAQQVVQAIHSKHMDDSEFSLIIMSIRNLLHVFSNFEVNFIKRQANSVAHSLAKAVNSWTRRSVINSIPPCIQPIILNEMH